MLWSPIHAKLKFTDKTIIHGDVFVVAGAGPHVPRVGHGPDLGGGLRHQALRRQYVTFRFDVRDFLLPQEVLGRGRITNNITVLGGVSVWVPAERGAGRWCSRCRRGR